MDFKKIFDIALCSSGDPKEALAITKEIRDFFQEVHGDTGPLPQPREEVRPPIEGKPPLKKARKTWSEKEITRMIALHADGMDYVGIANELDRSIHSIETAIYKFNTGRQLGRLKRNKQ
jgi:hypothetical protein